MRTVIVEDHVMFREVLRKVCVAECGCDVVGEGGTGRQARKILSNTRPDLLILDVHLPEGDGLAVAEYAKQVSPAIRILMVSSHCDDYTLFEVERANVHGFVDKNTQSVRALKLAIQALAEGRTYFSKPYLEAKAARANNPSSFAKVLSERECQVLSLIGRALSDAEIGQLLNVAPTTVQTHRSRIMQKLGIVNSIKLAQFAVQHGFCRVQTLRNGRLVLP